MGGETFLSLDFTFMVVMVMIVMMLMVVSVLFVEFEFAKWSRCVFFPLPLSKSYDDDDENNATVDGDDVNGDDLLACKILGISNAQF